MITNYMGKAPMGSNVLLTSVANVEIIPSGKTVYNFTMKNNADATILINGVQLFIQNGQGYSFDVVSSFKFITPDVAFNWFGVEA